MSGSLQIDDTVFERFDRGYTCAGGFGATGTTVLDGDATLRSQIYRNPAEEPVITVFVGTDLDAPTRGDDDNCDDVSTGDIDAQTIRMAYSLSAGDFTTSDLGDGLLIQIADLELTPDPDFLPYIDATPEDFDTVQAVFVENATVGPVGSTGRPELF